MNATQVNDLMDYGDRIDVKVTPVMESGLLGVTFLDMPTLFDHARALGHLQRIGSNVVCAGEGAVQGSDALLRMVRP